MNGYFWLNRNYSFVSWTVNKFFPDIESGLIRQLLNIFSISNEWLDGQCLAHEKGYSVHSYFIFDIILSLVMLSILPMSKNIKVILLQNTNVLFY